MGCTTAKDDSDDEVNLVASTPRHQHKPKGCCPCQFRSSCRAKALNLEVQIDLEGQIPEEHRPDSLIAKVRRGLTSAVVQLEKTPKGTYKAITPIKPSDLK